MKWWDQMPWAMILVFWMLSFKPTFSLSSFTFIKRLFSSSLPAIRVISSAYLRLLIFLLALDSSLCFVQPSVSHDVLCIEVKWAGWQYAALMYSVPYLEPVYCSTSSSNCCFLTFIQISQEVGQVVWYSHFFKNFPQFVVMWFTHKVYIESECVRSNLSFLLWYLEDDWWLETNSHTVSKARVDGVLMSLHLVNICKI